MFYYLILYPTLLFLLRWKSGGLVTPCGGRGCVGKAGILTAGVMVTVGVARGATQEAEAGMAVIPGGRVSFSFIPDFSKMVVLATGPGKVLRLSAASLTTKRQKNITF